MSTRYAEPYNYLLTFIAPSVLTTHFDCLAFSPDAEFLAAGSIEVDSEGRECGQVAVWDLEKGIMLKARRTESPVRSMIWHPDQRSVLIVGCKDGGAFIWNFLRNDTPSNVLLGLKGPVFAMAFNSLSQYLAAGIGDEVHVAKPLQRGEYATFSIMPRLPLLQLEPPNPDTRHRASGVHFLRNGERLVVSYLVHGIVCWDVHDSTKLWSITPVHSLHYIGSSALSPDEKTIAITNSRDGIDIYPLVPDARPIGSYRYGLPDPATNKAMTVAYMHKGLAIVCGSPSGNVCIWDVRSEDVMQTLGHEGSIVQVVSSGASKQHAFLATSKPLEGNTHAKITIWRASLDPSYKRPFPQNIICRAGVALDSWRKWVASQSDTMEDWVHVHPGLSFLVFLFSICIPACIIWIPTMVDPYPFIYHIGHMAKSCAIFIINAFSLGMERAAIYTTVMSSVMKAWIRARLRELLRNILQEDA